MKKVELKGENGGLPAEEHKGIAECLALGV
jgi:hypothetical protein